MKFDRLETHEDFYSWAKPFFMAGGPGRVTIQCDDQEIAQLEHLFHAVEEPGRIAADGALYVIPTPAGVVGIRRAPAQLRIQQIWRSRSEGRERVIVDLRNRRDVITRDLGRPLCDQGFGHQIEPAFVAAHYLIYDPWTGFDAGN